MKAIEIVANAQKRYTVIPAFNIPYLSMVKPVVDAIRDENSIGMVQVARLEWMKFESQSLEAVAEEYFLHCNPRHTLLHLDHVPVIDEDNRTVDVIPIIESALRAGYQSVMVDGSRLPLSENITITKRVSDIAHAGGVAVEAELGAVAGHESTGLEMSYEELFKSRKGFTQPEEAARFVEESGCDWLSVAVGSFHGSVAADIHVRSRKKPEARLDIQHIELIRKATNNTPLVLHGGSGIQQEFIKRAIENGIAKINIATDIRQPYEAAMMVGNGTENAREQVYYKTRWIIREFLQVSDSRKQIIGENVCRKTD